MLYKIASEVALQYDQRSGHSRRQVPEGASVVKKKHIFVFQNERHSGIFLHPTIVLRPGDSFYKFSVSFVYKKSSILIILYGPHKSKMYNTRKNN